MGYLINGICGEILWDEIQGDFQLIILYTVPINIHWRQFHGDFFFLIWKIGKDENYIGQMHDGSQDHQEKVSFREEATYR